MEEHFVDGLKQTRQLAKKIAPQIKKGSTIFMHGDVGSGKTTLARFILAELKVKQDVTSPTFAIVHVYKKSKIGQINHFDLYRIEEIEELREIGFDEMINSGTNFIEWPELVEEKLVDAKQIVIEKVSETERAIKVDL